MIIMAKVTNPNPDAPKNPNTKDMRLPGGTKRYRDAFKDALVEPAEDPHNPYANNKYRIQKTQQIWEQMRTCRKDVYNHSFSKYTLRGVQDDKQDFLTTGYMLGLNDISHSLSPTFGTWDAPECFCFTITDLLCNPLNLKSQFFLHTKSGNFLTSYNTFHSGGDRVSGSWKEKSAVQAAGVSSPFHFKRRARWFNWLEGMDRRNKLPMVPGFNVHGPFGTYYLNDINMWKITNASGNGYTAYFCPNGCDSSLCGVAKNKFVIDMNEEIATVEYTGPTAGSGYEAYWFDTKLFDFYVGNTIDEETKSASVAGYGIADELPYMNIGSNIDCIDGTVKYPGRVLKNCDPFVYLGPETPGKDGYGWIKSEFIFEDTPFPVYFAAHGPAAEFKLFTTTIQTYSDECGGSLGCGGGWWICGGLKILYHRMDLDVWQPSPFLIDVDFFDTGPDPCYEAQQFDIGLVDGIRCLVRNHPMYTSSTNTYVCGLHVNDKYYTPEGWDY